jgi:hypothetical protein
LRCSAPSMPICRAGWIWPNCIFSTPGVILSGLALWAFVAGLRRLQPYRRSFSGNEYVTTSGPHLELHCRPFYVAGFNTHDLVQNAMITATDYATPGQLSGDQMVSHLMSAAQNAGLNVVRTWAHTNHPRFPFQVWQFCGCFHS